MRARWWATFLAYFTACVAGSAGALQACSSPAADDTSVVDGDSPDAGGRPTSSSEEPDATCDPAADLFVEVRDAAIGDGSSTTGICLACAARACERAIDRCTENCSCQGIVRRSLECYLTTGKLGCVGSLANIFVSPETRSAALALLGCARSECPAECALTDETDAQVTNAPDSSAD